MADITAMAVDGAKELLEEANAATARLNFKDAVKACTDALDELEAADCGEPLLRASLLSGRGQARLALNDAGRAIVDFQEALQQNPDCALAAKGLEGSAADAAAHDSQEVGRGGNAAGVAAPEDVGVARKAAGNTSFKLGQFGDAIGHYTSAIEQLDAAPATDKNQQTRLAVLTNRALSKLHIGEARGCATDCDVSALRCQGCACVP